MDDVEAECPIKFLISSMTLPYIFSFTFIPPPTDNAAPFTSPPTPRTNPTFFIHFGVEPWSTCVHCRVLQREIMHIKKR
jgi:hypothetical protein